ncbi:hypothetical protein KVQ30_27485, partial [Klebsiella pneumoniae]|uniref:hypothetical protein n=1 Tax=Klebsiella pneumoniae TaxID=573 RepID=UPI001C3ECDC1
LKPLFDRAFIDGLHDPSKRPTADEWESEVGGQAVLGRQGSLTTPWLTERHGYDPTYLKPLFDRAFIDGLHDPSKRPTADEWES